MKKIFKWIFDIKLKEIWDAIKRFFGIYNKDYVKLRIKQSLLIDVFPCERMLDSRQKVEEFARFYAKNKELLYYVAWDLSYKYKNSTNSYLKFFEQCYEEIDKYRIQEEMEAKKKIKPIKRKTIF